MKDSLKLTLFLGAVRSFIEQSSPGLTQWETLNYEGIPYVRVKQAEFGLTAGARRSILKDWALYYSATPEAVTVSLREDVLHRLLARLKLRSTEEARKPKEFVVDSNIGVEAKRKFLGTLEAVGVDAMGGNAS